MKKVIISVCALAVIVAGWWLATNSHQSPELPTLPGPTNLSDQSDPSDLTDLTDLFFPPEPAAEAAEPFDVTDGAVANGAANENGAAVTGRVYDAASGDGLLDRWSELVTGLDGQQAINQGGAFETLLIYTSVFSSIALVAFMLAVVALICAPLIRKLMHGEH